MKKDQMTIKELYDTQRTIAGPYLETYTYPWEVFPHIGRIVKELGQGLSEEEFERVGEDVWIHKSVSVPPTATVNGPAIFGRDTEIRPGAFVRGNVLVGEGCVVGNSTELKNVILFDNVQVPHYNYVGDSILGYKSHMGAGSITSNVKSDKTLVKVHGEEGDIETGLKKFGAAVGDYVEVGCGSVLNPGTVVGPHSNIYPLSSVRGCVNKHSIYKRDGVIVEKEAR
ncbi:MAG: UDP-N-acetylglucosamine pyrophosphorylase [Hungatella sp.]|nr:UDP-N-acetylglucosamine pyrophosphorylase [Hungatella sp.]